MIPTQSNTLLARVWPLVVLVGALAFGGCSDDASNADPTDPGTRDAGDTLPTGDAGPDTGADQGPAPIGRRELQILDADGQVCNGRQGCVDRLFYFGAAGELKVRLIAVEGSVPVSNTSITLQMLTRNGEDRTNADVDGTQLRSARVRTDDSGVATVEVRAGNNATSLRIIAGATDADPIIWNVVIGREGMGALTVVVNHDLETSRYRYQDLAEVKVGLFSADKVCDGVEGLRANANRLPGAIMYTLPIDPFEELADNRVTETEIEDGTTLVVGVSAVSLASINDADTLETTVAFGCAEAIEIAGGSTTVVEISLSDLPLEFKGRFKTTSRFDLTDLLNDPTDPTPDVADSTLEYVDLLLEILQQLGSDENRGEALIDLFCTDIFDVDQNICDIINDIGGGLIDGLIEDYIPAEVLDVLAVISDVIGIFDTMTVAGDITFSADAPDADGWLGDSNDNAWNTFSFVWRNGCPAGADCTRDLHIGTAEDNRPINGQFSAHVDGWQLEIHQHPMNFRYGAILMGIIEEWVIPQVICPRAPNRDVCMQQDWTFNDLLVEFIPCVDIADFVPGLSVDACEDLLVSSLGDLIVDQINGLDFAPEEFQLSGTATLIDENGDLSVDRIENGDWNGVLQFRDPPFVFDGCFSGCLNQPCAAPACTIIAD